MTTVNILMEHNGLIRPTELRDVFELIITRNRFQGISQAKVVYVVDDCYYDGTVSLEDAMKIENWMKEEYAKLDVKRKAQEPQKRKHPNPQAKEEE